ncbi:FG-GAP-like repeat-containing protein [Streptomyces inhibens]|uniref:FG-GAP-like repeat-containing protein n=1 Tax=Streptomyces inhibens TaxID=2293571 RepID=UPI001EE78063|nr:FG-GAP-like repeat-containing protein [Streptomyces inhibens]UKY52110.1 FG-GAP-like repeat-containing protein [Streptomyces inhibens]
MPKHLRTTLATAAATALAAGLLTAATGTASAADNAAPAAGGRQGDFNGDGYRDLAVAAPAATVDGKKGAGAVTVLYGSANGVDASRRTTLTQNSPGVPGAAEADDLFGASLAAGDFNSDGYADLAVAAPYEDVAGDADGGTVQILWGASGGLSGFGSATLADPAPSQHDRFGAALAAGDFDRDGKADLATGTSSATLHVFKGGISKTGTPGAHSAVALPILGGAGNGIIQLTSGEVTDQGYADLVVSAYDKNEPYYSTNYYLPGTSSGLSGAGIKRLPGGFITAIGDVNGDGFGDLVTGMLFDDQVPGSTKGGKVNVIHGSADGPRVDQIDTITQESGAIPGSSEKGDKFGYEVSLGDINGDGLQDLAIGVAEETIDGASKAGAVTVLRGSPSGIDTSHNVQYFHENSPGVPGTDEANDFFGGEVFLSDLNGDKKADLTVGATYEDGGDGAIITLPSDGTRLTTTGSRYISPSTVGVSTAGAPQFGAIMAG